MRKRVLALILCVVMLFTSPVLTSAATADPMPTDQPVEVQTSNPAQNAECTPEPAAEEPADPIDTLETDSEEMVAEPSAQPPSAEEAEETLDEEISEDAHKDEPDHNTDTLIESIPPESVLLPPDRDSIQNLIASESSTLSLIPQILHATASDGASVQISGQLPIGAQASMKPVVLKQAELTAYLGTDLANSMAEYVAYDICILLNGEEYELDDTVSVKVSEPAIDIESESTLTVKHVHEDAQTSVVSVSDVDVELKDNETVSFETDSFSYYIFITGQSGGQDDQTLLSPGGTLTLDGRGSAISAKNHTWSTSNSSVLTVSKSSGGDDATVTAVGEGVATITHYADGLFDYTDTWTITVVKDINLDYTTVTGSKINGNYYSFSGTNDKQWVNVIVKVDGKVVSGAVVTLEFQDNDLVDDNDELAGAITGPDNNPGQGENSRSTGAWFRHIDLEAKTRVTVTYVDPVTGRKASGTANSGNTSVVCYQYRDPSWRESNNNWDGNWYKTGPGNALSPNSLGYVWLSDDDTYGAVNQLTVSLTSVPGSYYLTYDANGGSINYKGLSRTAYTVESTGTNFTIERGEDGSNFTATKSGYFLLGWSLDPNSVSGEFQRGETLNIAGREHARIYAVWGINPEEWRTLTFKTDGHGTLEDLSSPTATITKRVRVGTDLSTVYNAGDYPSYTPSSGYKFKNWSHTSGAVNTDMTITAYFESLAPKYTVSYNGNGATSGSTPSQTATYGTAFKLNNNGFVRQYQVSFHGNGAANPPAQTATATFNGWEDRNSFTYNGTTYTYTQFNAPFYSNHYSDLKAAFGYDKYALINHYITYTVNGSETRIPVGAAPSLEDLYPNGATVNNLVTGSSATLYANWTLGSVTLPTLSRTDYSFDGWYTAAEGGTFVGKSGSYTPSAATTLYAHWTPKEKYEVTFHHYLQGTTEKLADDTTAEIAFNTVITAADYKLTNIANHAFVSASPATHTVSTSGNEISLYYKPLTAAYTVEIYHQHLEGPGYDKGTYTGTGYSGNIDSIVTIDPKVYESTGFHYNDAASTASGKITADGGLVLKLYFDRDIFTVSYSYTGAVPATAPVLPEALSYRYNANVSVAEAPSLKGYTFSGWSKTGTFNIDADTSITGSWEADTNAWYQVNYLLQGSTTSLHESKKVENLTYANEFTESAISILGYHVVGANSQQVVAGLEGDNNVITFYYAANTDTKYQVEHYLRSFGAASPLLKETDYLEGTTNTITQAEANTYAGYQADAFEQLQIKGDGSTVVKIYYTEAAVTISYTAGSNGSVAPTQDGPFGAATGNPQGSVPTPADGFKFDGWYTDAEFMNAVSSDLVDRENKLIPRKNTSGIYETAAYYAKFVPIQSEISIVMHISGRQADRTLPFTGTMNFELYENSAQASTSAAYSLKDGQTSKIVVSAGKGFSLSDMMLPSNYTFEKVEYLVDGQLLATASLMEDSAVSSQDFLLRDGICEVHIYYRENTIPNTGLDLGQQTPVLVLSTLSIVLLAVVLLGRRRRRIED